MKSSQKPLVFLFLALLSLGLLFTAPARAASLQQVSNWGAMGVPSYMQMYTESIRVRAHPRARGGSVRGCATTSPRFS